MNTKRILQVLLGATVGFAISGGAALAEEPEVTIKFGHFAAESHPGNIAAKSFAENVTRRTNGKVTFEIFPASQLGATPEVLEQTVLGVVDMNLPTQGTLDKYEKAFATVMMPYAYGSYAEAHRFLDGPFFDWVAPKLEDQGLIMLSNWEWGFRHMTNNKRPINSPADVRGLKFRTPPEIQLVAAIEASGGSATQINFPELPAALNQGVVDGQENPIGVIYAFKIYEFQDHLALTGHSYNSMVHVMNKDSWDKLSVNQQRIFLEESRRAGELMRKMVQEAEASQLAELESKFGMKITRPNTDEFRKLMQPAYERVAEYAGKENVAKFLELLNAAK